MRGRGRAVKTVFGRRSGLAMALVLALAACGDPEIVLEGERFDVRQPLSESADAAAAADKAAEGLEGRPITAREERRRARDLLRRSEAKVPERVVISDEAPIRLASARNHASWTHRAGNASHNIGHAALARPLTQIWSTRIGAGNKRKIKITAAPVAAEGRIFTLDAESLVSAVSTGGGILWQRNLTPLSEKSGEASGGGLAVVNGTLYVTTGFGRLHALEAATGRQRWVQNFDAPVAGAPTVVGDTLYVSTRDNRAIAVRTDTGRLVWELPVTQTISTVLNGAGPAVGSRVVVFPFGTAELIGVLRQSGVRIWSTTLAGQRQGRAYTGVTDITSDPVISGSRVYAGSPSGRVAAIDLLSGERIWTATQGAIGPVWPEGNSVFFLNDQAQLVRLENATGQPVWIVDLPYFQEEKNRRRQSIYAHFGPVMAGGRLIVVSDDGLIRSFDPRSGQQLERVLVRGGAATPPAVVGGVLYFVTTEGNLVAFR